MKTTVTSFDFIDAFRRYDRFDQFGREALEALFAYLEEMEADTGEEMKLDVIALCCDYSVDSVEDIRACYVLDDEVDVVEWLREETTVVAVLSDGRVLYCSAF